MKVSVRSWIRQISTWGQRLEGEFRRFLGVKGPKLGDDVEMFLGTGIGRSGTLFLSKLLDRGRDARVFHEPVREDVQAFRKGYDSSEERYRYLRDYRIPEIWTRLGANPPKVYGEVNSYLRRHIVELRRLVPGIRVFHLVRDGRDVVRSAFARKAFRPGDEATEVVEPTGGELNGRSWEETKRFQKLSWYWASSNRFVRERADWTVRFEELLSDYEYFKSELAKPLGVEIERAVWENEVNSPKNTTKKHELPPPRKWSESRKDQFWGICGEEMRKNGYTRR